MNSDVPGSARVTREAPCPPSSHRSGHHSSGDADKEMRHRKVEQSADGSTGTGSARAQLPAPRVRPLRRAPLRKVSLEDFRSPDPRDTPCEKPPSFLMGHSPVSKTVLHPNHSFHIMT